MKKIKREDFIEEIKQFGVKSFPENIEVRSFPVNSEFNINKNLTDDEKAVQKILHNESLKLASGQVSVYHLNGKELLFVSSDFIVCQDFGVFKVMDIFCNQLYSFSYKPDGLVDQFCLWNDHFSVDTDLKNNPIYSFIFYDTTNFPYKNVTFTLKNDNKFKVSSDFINLTSITFENDKILTTFKSSAYSSIIFDYDFNIKEIELNKSIKQKIGMSENKKYYDFKSYPDLIKTIKESLTDELEFYTLINDSKLKLKGSEQKFEKDLLYIKEITERRLQMNDLVKQNNSKILSFYNFYKKNNYLKTLDCSVPDSKDGRMEIIKDTLLSKYEIEKKYFDNILLLLILNKKNNNNFMNSKALESYKDFSNGSSEIMSFNKKIINLKNMKKIDKQKI